MKKLGKYFILIAIVLVCALINTIVFLTIDDARLDTKVFWLAWAFATPWSLLTTAVLHIWAAKKPAASLKMPVAYYLCAIFSGIYMVLGLIFMYADTTEITLPLILELVVTVAYVIMALYVFIAGSYVGASEKETKKKVFFIRMLQSNITSLLPMVKDTETKAALEELSEKIRYSDPMSHASLAMVECEIAATVDEITGKLTSGDENVGELIKKAELQLARRNSQCLMLK